MSRILDVGNTKRLEGDPLYPLLAPFIPANLNAVKIDLKRCGEISGLFSTLRECTGYAHRIAKSHTFKEIMGHVPSEFFSHYHTLLQNTRLLSSLGMLESASKVAHHFQKIGKNQDKVLQTHLRLLNAFRQFANATASFTKGLSAYQVSTVLSDGRVVKTSIKALAVASTVFGTIGAILSVIKLIEHIRGYRQTIEFLQKLDAIDLKQNGSEEQVKNLILFTKTKVLSKHFNTDGKVLQNKITDIYSQFKDSLPESKKLQLTHLLKDRLQSSLNHQKLVLLNDVLYVTGSMLYVFQVQQAASTVLQEIGFAWGWTDLLYNGHSSSAFLNSIQKIN